MLLFFSLHNSIIPMFRWLFNLAIFWWFNFTNFWWFKVTYYKLQFVNPNAFNLQ